MIAPAITNRTAARTSGGIVSSPTLMARYVLPQTTHTMSNATHARRLTRRTTSVFSIDRTTCGASPGPTSCSACGAWTGTFRLLMIIKPARRRLV